MPNFEELYEASFRQLAEYAKENTSLKENAESYEKEISELKRIVDRYRETINKLEKENKEYLDSQNPVEKEVMELRRRDIKLCKQNDMLKDLLSDIHYKTLEFFEDDYNA